ncbi:hypothetical protein FACS189496_4550 [Bacilli bacterium]|nr:hypothetical protein FACS189496_4550 [Bacilli bacterium]
MKRVLIATFWMVMFVADYGITPTYNLLSLEAYAYEDDDDETEYEVEAERKKNAFKDKPIPK